MPELGRLFINTGMRRVQEHLIALINQAIANGEIMSCDSRLAASHLYGMITGFDVSMSRFSEDPLHEYIMRSNARVAIDRFCAVYAADARP